MTVLHTMAGQSQLVILEGDPGSDARVRYRLLAGMQYQTEVPEPVVVAYRMPVSAACCGEECVARKCDRMLLA